jgi:predicted RNA binding protein YcfA (HicA-like mRNA interferase family)
VPEGFYKEVSRLLKEAGFAYLRNAKGSHELWQEERSGRTVLVPRNLGSRHTANGILKDAGIPKKF